MRGFPFVIVLTLAGCAVDGTEPDEPRTAASPTVSDEELPQRLDAEMIRAAVDPVKEKVLACPNDAHAAGIVKVRLDVQPDGSVAAVALPLPPPDQRPFAFVESPELRDCAARTMATAVFPRTKAGGSFTYPLAF